MNKKNDTGKYFPVRVTGDFDKHLTELAAHFDRSKADTVRYCVKLVYERELPDTQQKPT